MLDAARRGLAQSKGRMILIGGEAGIGKSRLLAQFLRGSGDGRPRNIVSAECFEQVRAPLGPIRTWIAALLRAYGRERLPAELGRGVAQLLDRESSADFEKSELFAALADFIGLVAAKRATIASIEDIQWADAASLDFLTFLAPRVSAARLLVAATYRLEDKEGSQLRGALGRIGREPTTIRIELRPFASAELRTLLIGAAEGHAVPLGDLLPDVETRSEGNPFFAEELLKSAIEARGQTSSTSLPISIRAGILERVAKLLPEHQEVVTHAAVLGYRFDPTALALIIGSPLETILPALRLARDANLIVEEEGERIRFRFRHALTRQAICDDMLRFDARRIHERILSALEAGPEAESHLDELAEHAWEARDAAKTLLYNERAGVRALELHALSEARVCFERALGVAVEAPDQARLRERSAGVAMLQGRTNNALPDFEAALEIYRSLQDYDRAADMVREIVTERNNAGDPRPLAIAATFLAEHGAEISRKPRERLMTLLAQIAAIHEDFTEARRFRDSISEPTRLEPRARTNYLLSLLTEAWHAGDARAWADGAMQLSEVIAGVPPYNALIILYTLAANGTWLAEQAIVERALERADAIEARREFRSLHVYGSALRATYWTTRGQLSRARVGLERAIEGCETAVSEMATAMIAPWLAALLDDDRLLPPHLAESFRRATLETAITGDGFALGARAYWNVARGRLEDARLDLRHALRTLPRATPAAGLILTLAAEHLPEDELNPICQLTCDVVRAPSDRVGTADAALVQAILARRSGDRAAAVALATSAAEEFRVLGWPLFEARALEVADRIPEAIEVYRVCNAIGELRRLGATKVSESPVHVRAASALSERERAVAELVALGLTNVQIGDRLGVSVKTIEKQVSSIFAKAGLRSRAQIATMLAGADADANAGSRSAL